MIMVQWAADYRTSKSLSLYEDVCLDALCRHSALPKSFISSWLRNISNFKLPQVATVMFKPFRPFSHPFNGLHGSWCNWKIRLRRSHKDEIRPSPLTNWWVYVHTPPWWNISGRSRLDSCSLLKKPESSFLEFSCYGISAHCKTIYILD